MVIILIFIKYEYENLKVEKKIFVIFSIDVVEY